MLLVSYNERLLGARVRVWWENDKEWYAGTVMEYSAATNMHTVVYDDGDQREEPLNFPEKVKWERL